MGTKTNPCTKNPQNYSGRYAKQSTKQTEV